MFLFNLSLFVFLLVLLGLIVYPLRAKSRLAFSIGFMTWLIATVCYIQFGHWSLWKEESDHQSKMAEAQRILKTFKNKDEIIQTLKSKLKHTKESAQGWYLLGRLYGQQNQWQAASEAFHEAHILLPEKEAYFVEYTVSLWQRSHQHMTPQVRAQFHQILAHDPKQGDALMFLAMDAYQHHHLEEAIRYWTRLLELVPDDSDEAKMIRQAIEKAKS